MISVKDSEYWEKHKCPVCGKYEFPMHGSNEVCEVCGWEDDSAQEDDLDFGGANWETLRGYRELYKNGMHTAGYEEKYDWLVRNGIIKEVREDGEHYIIGEDGR